VWHTGELWEAAVDVGEDGDMSAFAAMTDYRVRRDHRTFNPKVSPTRM
jgi:hypothetical protein